jgi:hypothetical protein
VAGKGAVRGLGAGPRGHGAAVAGAGGGVTDGGMTGARAVEVTEGGAEGHGGGRGSWWDRRGRPWKGLGEGREEDASPLVE